MVDDVRTMPEARASAAPSISPVSLESSHFNDNRVNELRMFYDQHKNLISYHTVDMHAVTMEIPKLLAFQYTVPVLCKGFVHMGFYLE